MSVRSIGEQADTAVRYRTDLWIFDGMNKPKDGMGYAVTSASQTCSRRTQSYPAASVLRAPASIAKSCFLPAGKAPKRRFSSRSFIQSSVISMAQFPVRKRHNQRWQISFHGKTKKAGTSLRTDLRFEGSPAPLHPWSPGRARPFISSSCRNRTSEPSRGHPCWYRRKPSRCRCRQQVPSRPDRSRRSLRPCQGSRRRSQSRR